MTTPPVLTQMQSNFSGGTTFGTTVAAAGSTNTKGAFVQLIASTNFEVYGLWVACLGPNVEGADNRMLLDIAKGPAGSEIIIVPNILSGHKSTAWHNPLGYYPLLIPAGTRISARAQAAVASRSQQIAVWLFGTPADISNPPAVANSIQAVGADTSDSGGTNMTPGVSGAEGAWASLGTVISDAKGVILIASLGGDVAVTSGGWTVDLGVGPTSSEVAVFTDFYMRNVAGGDYVSPIQPTVQALYGLDLPAGTQLNVRASYAAASADVADAVAYALTGYEPVGGPAGLTVAAAYKIQSNIGPTGDVTNRADTGPAFFLGHMTSFSEITDKPELHKVTVARERRSRW